MEISIKGKGVDVGDALRAHVQNQVASAVAKYFSKAHGAMVTVCRDGGHFRVDISVHPARGLLVQGQGAAADAYAAFDGAFERIAKQLRRYKRRLNDHHRSRGAGEIEAIPAQHYVLAAEAPEVEELPADGQPVIIAELQTEIVSLSVGEAVMRMDLGDLPALMFRNQGSGVLNVVFRRPDGNIGWIDPANTRSS